MFGTMIKAERLARNMTQKQMAEDIGININTLASYEKETREPNFETLRLLSKYFGCSTDYLLGLVVYRNAEEKEKLEQSISNLFDNLVRIKNPISRDRMFQSLEKISISYLHNSTDVDLSNIFEGCLEVFSDFLHVASMINMVLLNGDLELLVEHMGPRDLYTDLIVIFDLSVDYARLLKRFVGDRIPRFMELAHDKDMLADVRYLLSQDYKDFESRFGSIFDLRKRARSGGSDE